MRGIKNILLEQRRFPPVTQLLRSATPIIICLTLIIGAISAIFYVQQTLSEIEEALPITLSKQERDIRRLVQDMGTLLQNIEFTRAEYSPLRFKRVVFQVDKISARLEGVRESYRFNDLLGISTIHATLNPAIFDIQNWLGNGIYNFDAQSKETLTLVHQRALLAYSEANAQLDQVGEMAVAVLSTQAKRIQTFRHMLLALLTIVLIMTLVLVLLAIRLQKSVVALSKSEEQTRFRANFDYLTKLPNRASFVEQLNETISRSKRNPSTTALLFIDLDRFKNINDTLGHDHGDDLIKQVGERIVASVRKTDLAARLGGDEFTVLLKDVNDPIHASIIAKNIITRLSEPFDLKGYEVYTGASIGITIYPEDGEDGSTLLKNADMAMYGAKEDGRNRFRFFAPEMTQQAKHFLELDKDMRLALQQDQFELRFQPIYRIDVPTMMGVEVLLRWQHPTKGLIGPDEFIPIAEETGVIAEIGLWVLRQACKQAVTFLEQTSHPEFYLAINVSIRQFKSGFGRHQVTEILEETGFPCENLLFEITESLLMDNDVKIKEALNDFRDMGIRLAVDDFGKGYSSLGYLRQFPLTTLKIDRSFVHDIATKVKDRRLVEAIVGMARGLGLSVVAEGVETAEQEDVLRSIGCDLVQGYFYGKPLFAHDIDGRFEAEALAGI